MGQITLQDVQKSFGPVHIIKGADLDIADGSFVVFVGPSGCGKTTLLRLIAGLEDVSGGKILIDGKNVVDTPPAKRGLSMVFQSYALYPHMSVRGNIGFGLKMAGLPKDEINRKVEAAAATLNLSPYLDRKPRELSGGQRQRVAMGRAIVRDPQVFLFDEPLSNLDAKLRVQTRLEIQKLHRELGVTSLFVTHDQVEAMTLAQRIVVMNGGRMEQFGTPEEVYGRPATTFVASFIGSPAMNLLKGRVEAGAGGRRFVIGNAVLPLPQPAPREGELILGLRPEHALPHDGQIVAGDTTAWPLKVEMVEMLGAERLVYGRLGDATFTLRIDGTDAPPRPGDEVLLKAPAERLHWFDPATGQRVD